MKDLWKDDKIQFARFISEAEAIGLFTHKAYEELGREMDLAPYSISKLIDRAQAVFEDSKKHMVRYCKRCGTPIKKNGHCKDLTCPYSSRKQTATFTED